MSGEGWLDTAISGVARRRLTVHADERGAFSEIWRESWTSELVDEPFVQANLSRSRPGVLRGMHFHDVQTDLWILAEGRATVALVDLRTASSEPAWTPPSDVVDLDAGEALMIPPRVAHGFYAVSELVLVYLVTREFDATDEHGFAWDDPLAAIPWHVRRPILSARDRANPSLRVVLAELTQGQSAGA